MFEGCHHSGWEKTWERDLGFLDHIDSFMLCNLTNINKLGQRNDDSGRTDIGMATGSDSGKGRNRNKRSGTSWNKGKQNRTEQRTFPQRKRKSQVFARAFVAGSRFSAFPVPSLLSPAFLFARASCSRLNSSPAN